MQTASAKPRSKRSKMLKWALWGLGIACAPLFLAWKGPMYLTPWAYYASRPAFEALEHKLDANDRGNSEETDRWEHLYRSKLLGKVPTPSAVFDAIIDYDFSISLKGLTRAEMRLAIVDADRASAMPAEVSSAARQKSLKLTRRYAEVEAAVKLCRADAAQYFEKDVHATGTCTKVLAPLKVIYHAEHPKL
jgi:hypothetical protein